MAAVPVNMMHGLPIPTPMQVMPCSSMLSIPISTMSYNTSNTLTSNDFSPQMQMQDSSTMVNPNHVGNPVASSPSRSLSSASPPASSMMNGSTMMASASSPLPEENPEYLKELQAEKDTLELSSSVNGSSSEIPTGENNENNENQNKTNHALKLLEQGKNSFYFLSKNHSDDLREQNIMVGNVGKSFGPVNHRKQQKKIRLDGGKCIYFLLEKWIISQKSSVWLL